MKRPLYSIIGFLFFTVITLAQSIPKELWGNWKVRREVPTGMISCWGQADAKKIVHTEIEYLPRVFRWQKVVIKDPIAKSRIVTGEQFQKEYSSPSSSGSQVDFHQLGIKAREVENISIQHPPASISGATTEIPGDDVLLKNANTIIFSVCSVFFEAERIETPKRASNPN